MAGSTGLISVNGKVTPPELAVVPALDRGLLFGDGVFEVLVAFGKKILDLPQHLARLRSSAETLGFEIPWGDAELEFELQALVDQVGALKTYLRLAVTRGTGLSLKLPAKPAPNRIVYCMPAAEEPKSTYEIGLALKRVLQNGTTRGAAPKTGNYLPSVLALARAQNEGFDDVLWTNGDGEITEASTANVFFMAREGDNYELLTPPISSGILPGITRATLLALMNKAGIPCREHLVFADELARFDEAFLCSTVRGLVPVARIDRHKLHSARPGSVFRHLERLYNTWVRTEVGHRVDWASGRRQD